MAASPSNVWICRVDGVVVGVSGWTLDDLQTTFERLANDYTLCRHHLVKFSSTIRQNLVKN